jgi:predicted transcriptional regulator
MTNKQLNLFDPDDEVSIYSLLAANVLPNENFEVEYKSAEHFVYLTRNPAFQQMFMLIGRAEKAGSGVDKIMTGWQASHWRRPFLEIENQPDRVKLTLPMFSVIPDAVLNELNAFFDDVSNLTADELTALSFCQIEGSISNQRLQYVLNMHSADITTLLKKLCANDYLESDNNGRWTTYKLKEKVATLTPKVDTSNMVATSTKLIDNQNNSKKRLQPPTQRLTPPAQRLTPQIWLQPEPNYLKCNWKKKS